MDNTFNYCKLLEMKAKEKKLKYNITITEEALSVNKYIHKFLMAFLCFRTFLNIN